MKSNKKENILICKGVRFYCRKDEDAFFEWIKKIDCIDETSASGDELYLHIAADDIHDDDRQLLHIPFAVQYPVVPDTEQRRELMIKRDLCAGEQNKPIVIEPDHEQ